MPSSFIRDASLAPIRYRTPSPPIHAFEPLSPLSYEVAPAEALGSGLRWANDNTGARNGRKRPYISKDQEDHDVFRDDNPSGGTMDAFASIALATKPNSLYTSRISIERSCISEYNNGERATKRARSEKLPSPDWRRRGNAGGSRPTTSSEQSPERRRFEAELLVNFAQEAAKLTTPSPVLSKVNTDNLRRASETSIAAPPAPSITRTSEEIHVVFEDSRPTDTEDLQGPPFSPLSNPATNDEPATSELGSDFHVDIGPKVIPDAIPQHQGDTQPSMPVNPLANPSSHAEASDQHTAAGHAGEDLDISEEHGSRSETFDHEEPAQGTASPPNAEMHTHQEHEERNLVEVEMQDAAKVLRNTQDMTEDALQAQEDGSALDGKISLHIASKDQCELDVKENESRVMHGALQSKVDTVIESTTKNSDAALSILESDTKIQDKSHIDIADAQPSSVMTVAVCAACKFARNSVAIEKDDNSTSWISCDACKDWFHFACAGFKNEREVRSVDKFRCRKCRPVHGPTTYVRKSSRAHSAIDYAGLHQGVIKTSDESPEHHYIKPIKDGTITFLPENFARMRPELVTAEYFEKGIGMKEPVVIPACFNPQPNKYDPLTTGEAWADDETRPNPLDDGEIAEDWFSRHHDSESVPDHGQDALDMVIPQGLTVRQVCELYGPEEKVEVIDVKSQNGENKKWNMRRWADYYEDPNNKVVRNVISLEVSQSKLGRLIRRPKIVRDLDLQDSVWPRDLLAKGEHPRVQFYCLMSVADCFTDFHIDFGGSSVFYHILKGKKTFLFIPPKEKHLKKYEEWCMSPAQNWTFLGDQTNECYRVDLSVGDTMLIPAGWIHAVWTPEDSLVIGGNFLTRMNFAMQLRIAEVEKATGVARKFRYPNFQKLQWYTALRYLEDDPLPNSVRDLLHSGEKFHRAKSAYLDFDAWGENSRPGSENYHAKYYSQSELEGLPHLVRYLLRTALIDLGSITEGISTDTRNAVRKAIPRGHGHGEPLEAVKAFAAWVAWKRGDEPIPHWAYPDAVPTLAPDKLSAAATKRLDREAALSAPRRQSARMQSQQEALERLVASQDAMSVRRPPSSSIDPSTPVGVKRPAFDLTVHGQNDLRLSGTHKRPRITEINGSHRKTACESCRKRRRACKHKDQIAPLVLDAQSSDSVSAAPSSASTLNVKAVAGAVSNNTTLAMNPSVVAMPETASRLQVVNNGLVHPSDDFAARLKTLPQDVLAGFPQAEQRAPGDTRTNRGPPSSNQTQGRPRTKACNECRKSKRRCVHDIYGNEDPIKLRETAIPRPHARKSHIQGKVTGKKPATPSDGGNSTSNLAYEAPIDIPVAAEQVRKRAPVANMIARPPTSDTQGVVTSSLPGVSLQVAAELALDAALLESNPHVFPDGTHRTEPVHFGNPSAEEVESAQKTLTEMPAQLEREWQMDISCSLRGGKVDTVNPEARDSYEQPASSLVSPPASSDSDAGHSPRAPNQTWTPSTSSSRQSSRQPKLIQTHQRYTPESGPIRRASSSSYGGNTGQREVQNGPSPLVTEPPSSDLHSSHQKLGSEALADEQSLKLIKELQAQEYGLRRRVGTV